MPKLDVGVGDEFPAKEVRHEVDEDEPVIHHHHYYRRYRRPGGFIRLLLWLVLISFLFRAMNWLFAPPGAWNMHHGWYAWGPWGMPFWGFFPALGLFSMIVVLGLALWVVRGHEGEQKDKR